MALDAGAFAKAIQGVKAAKPALETFEATKGIVPDAERMLALEQKLSQIGELEAKVQSKILREAKVAYEETTKNLLGKIGGTLYSNPFADPAIYADLVKMAYYQIKRGALSFEQFLLELHQRNK